MRTPPIRDRRPVVAHVKPHTTLFQPLPVVFSVLRETGAPKMIDVTTRWVAVPNTHADDVMARLEARGHLVELVEVRP